MDIASVTPERRYALAAELARMGRILGELRSASEFNDPDIRDKVVPVLTVASELVRTANDALPDTIADDLKSIEAALSDVLREYDPGLDEPMYSLRQAHQRLGLLVIPVQQALKAANALGLKPNLGDPLNDRVQRDRVDPLGLADVLASLERIEERLEALEVEAEPGRGSAQQIGLISYYVSRMRVQLDLAKLELSIKNVIDFGSVSRAVGAAASLTHDFTATARAMMRKVSDAVRAKARGLAEATRAVAGGVASVVRQVRRVQEQAEAAASQIEERNRSGSHNPPPDRGSRKVAVDYQPLAAGFIIPGDYRICSVLGHGVFGITYLADDISLGRQVVIKEYFPASLARRTHDGRVHPTVSSNSEVYERGKERFEHDARTVARLRHESIVRVLRCFGAHGTSYMVTGLVEGDSLAQLARKAPLGENAVQDLAEKLLGALELIHANGYLHRDVSPGNIIVAETQQPVLVDFGSFRYFDPYKKGATVAIIASGYSPMEQYSADSTQQGPWSDIYSLAATLYELIAGVRPQEAPERVMDDRIVPAVKAGNGRFPGRFLQGVDLGLSVLPKDRPQSIAAWRRVLIA